MDSHIIQDIPENQLIKYKIEKSDIDISKICDMFFDKQKEPWKYAKLYSVLELLKGKEIDEIQKIYFDIENV